MHAQLVRHRHHGALAAEGVQNRLRLRHVLQEAQPHIAAVQADAFRPDHFTAMEDIRDREHARSVSELFSGDPASIRRGLGTIRRNIFSKAQEVGILRPPCRSCSRIF